MINPELFPDATLVVELTASPENRTHVAQIAGAVKPDWSNAIMIGHPVYVVDSTTLYGYVPVRNAVTGRIKTDDNDCIVCELRAFPIPEGHALTRTERTAR